MKGALSFVKSGMEQLRLQYSEEFAKLGNIQFYLRSSFLSSQKYLIYPFFYHVVKGKHFYTLSNAASSYHKVLEENRKLYNQIQDLKGIILNVEGTDACYLWYFINLNFFSFF